RAEINADAEFFLHVVYDDGEMHVAHAGDDQLAGVGIARHVESRVFLDQPVQSHADLFLVLGRVRVDSITHYRLWELDGREYHAPGTVAQGVVDMRILEFGERDYLAGAGLGGNRLRLPLNSQQLRDALLAAAGDVDDVHVGAQRAGDDADVSEMTGVRID